MQLLSDGSALRAPRTILFVPGDRVDAMLAKAVQSGADAVAIDLEDSVLPQDKVVVREAVTAALRSSASDVPVFVRVNSARSDWFVEDVSGLVPIPNVVGIMLPKCETQSEIQEAHSLIRHRPIALIPMIESARGVLAAPALAAATDGVVGLALGAEDLAAENGMRRTASGREISFARSHVVLAAHAAGRWAIDTPCLSIDRPTAVRRDAAIARNLGFDGKLVLHPRQVQTVHEVFSPTLDEVRLASKIVDAYSRAARSGRGVTTVSGQMVDAPIASRATRLLRRADENLKPRR